MRNRIIILGAVVLLVIAAASGAWFYAAGQISQQVEALAFNDGETSPQLSCANLSVSGYPFAFDVDCTDAVIVSGDILIEVPGLRASAQVTNLFHYILSAKGAAEISDSFSGQRSTLAWSGMQASLRFADGRIERLSVVADDLAWNDSLFTDALIAHAGHAEMHFGDMPEAFDPANGLASLAIYLVAQDVEVPALTLANTEVEAEAELSGVPADVFALGATPVLPLWQQAGGRLKVVSVRASDPNSDLTAQGDLGLDDQGYLEGALEISSAGVAGRIGPMIEEPWRTLVLGVAGPDGRHTNQLNFRGGALSSGLVPIASLPPLF